MELNTNQTDASEFLSIFTEHDLDEIAQALRASNPKISDETDQQQITLTLKYPKHIVNGIVPVEISNLDAVYPILLGDGSESLYVLYYLSWRFKFENKNKYYPNNIWQRKTFDDVRRDNRFWIKVPSFLLPYSLEFKLNIVAIDTNIGEQGNADEKFRFNSTNYSVDIPSSLIDNKRFNVDDEVEFAVQNASFTREGVVKKLLENDMIEIETADGYDIEPEEIMVIVHKSKVHQQKVQNQFAVNITNSRQGYNDLILRNNEKLDMFVSLSECLSDIYHDVWGRKDIDYTEYDIEAMSNMVAVCICDSLYSSKYRYRIHCILDGYDALGPRDCWSYIVRKIGADAQHGIIGIDLRSCWDGATFSCDLCRAGVGYFEYMWHCNNHKHQHDYCLSCVHAMMFQYEEMKGFLSTLLTAVINDDCIEEIVVFCVGRVIKFQE